MTSTIRASDVDNVHLYSGRSSEDLYLCPSHQDRLCRKLSTDINDLVATRLFQTHFCDFLPQNDTDEVDVNIHITETTITVKNLTDRRTKTIDISGLADTDVADVEEINADILHKANKAYRKCRAETHRSHPHSRSHTPPEGYATRRARARDHFGAQPSRSQSPSPTSSSQSDSDYESRHSLKGNVHILRERAEALRSEGNLSSQQEVELAHLEEALRALETQEAELTHLRYENEILQGQFTPQISRDHFEALVNIANQLASAAINESTTFPGEIAAQFERLPRETQYAIFYQTYLLVDPNDTEQPWPVGERLFLGQNIQGDDISAQNLCRSHAIHYYLLHTLANEFAKTPGTTPPQELLDQFNALPEEIKHTVFTQLKYVELHGIPHEDTIRRAQNAFYGRDRQIATNLQRHNALIRSLLDNIAEYHRHRNRTKMDALNESYLKAMHRYQAELKELLKRTEETDQDVHF